MMRTTSSAQHERHFPCLAPLLPSPARPGHGQLAVDLVAGQSVATSVCATSPLKLLTPRSRGPSVWAYLSSFGGGLVAGDETHLHVRLGENTRCFVGTQASTKIYRNPFRRPCSHRFHATLAAGSLLVLAPDPVQPFAGSVYAQHQEFYLEAEAGLVLLDWCSSGRSARGERWAFSQFHSRNEVFVGDERLLLDSLLLDPAEGPLGSPHRMSRFNCLALVLILGSSLREPAAKLLNDVAAQPVAGCAPLLCSASPVRDGALLRIAGEELEAVGREIHRHLAFMPSLLGDDPWARKW